MEGDPVDLAQTSVWLEDAGYQVLAAADMNAAAQHLCGDGVDAIVYSLDSADAENWHWLQLIRQLSHMPILVASTAAGRRRLENEIKLQFDDYLPKPLSQEVLLTRLRIALEARSSKRRSSDLVFQEDGLTIDWKRMEVWVDKAPVALSPTEFKLLSLLVRRRGWVVTSEEILSYVWGEHYEGEKEYVKLYIWYLRRKLERDPARPRWIITRRGIGYSFADRASKASTEETASPRWSRHDKESASARKLVAAR